MQVVLIENDIDARPFSSQVLACLPPLPWSVSAEDLANPIRQDLRHICVFSVDPPGLCSYILTLYLLLGIAVCWLHIYHENLTVKNNNFFSLIFKDVRYLLFVLTGCKDIDDALHCTALLNGNFEVGVRILSLSCSCAFICMYKFMTQVLFMFSG